MLRRLAILFVVLLVLSAVLTALAPTRDPADQTHLTGAPAREDVTAALRATLPRDRVVRARIGDSIDLAVTARAPDSAAIDAFGLSDAATPGAPAQFSFRADRAGRFPVTLTLSGQRAGLIVVSGAGRSPAAR